MTHAYIAGTREDVRTIARPAMAAYLAANLGMQQDNSAGLKDDRGFTQLSERENEIVIRTQVNNNLCSTLSFVGTLEECARQAEVLYDNGVDEIACLIDFGIRMDEVLASLRRLAVLVAN